MLRWLLAILILANLAALAAVLGVFGPTPAAGSRTSQPLSQQIHPERLTVRAILPSESIDVPVVGGPVAQPDVQTQTLPQ